MTGVPTKQRQILGPAWDLIQQINRAESQWRETCPDLVGTMACAWFLAWRFFG